MIMAGHPAAGEVATIIQLPDLHCNTPYLHGYMAFGGHEHAVLYLTETTATAASRSESQCSIVSSLRE
jgi:hypothetical protein